MALQPAPDTLARSDQAKVRRSSDVGAFRDGVYRNTVWTGTLRNHLTTAAALLASRGRKLILMVYALNLSNTEVAPDVDYVRRVTTVGVEYLRQGTIGGIVHFGLYLTPGAPGRGDWNYSYGSGRGALALVLHRR
jgi:hypothetical protein